jgi:hypothetical protein
VASLNRLAIIISSNHQSASIIVIIISSSITTTINRHHQHNENPAFAPVGGPTAHPKPVPLWPIWVSKRVF